MNFKGIHLSSIVIEYFRANKNQFHDWAIGNTLLEEECGIKTFFENSDQFNQLISLIKTIAKSTLATELQVSKAKVSASQ